MNTFKNLAVMSIAAIMLIACGGDNGSSAKDEDSSSSVADEEKSSSSTKNSSSSDKESSSSAKESSSSQSKYVCDIYTLADALSCKCDENREGKLSYNYDSDVELVCIHDEELNKWGWVVKKEESSSSSAKSSSSTAKSSSSVASSSSAKSSSSSSSTTENQEGLSSSSKNSKYDFEWNVAEDVLQNPCNESIDGKIGKAWYRDDQGEFQCSYNKKYRDWEWTQIGGISSSSVKSSSSSAKSSSSSEYVPFDHSTALASGLYIDRSRYKQFTDERNGRSYYYLTINGKTAGGVSKSITVMTENLNIGKDVDGKDDQNDDTIIERYCYNNDTTKCDEFGGLYQWAEMMQLPSRCNTESCADLIETNHQGICPDGWRLFTVRDFDVVLRGEGNKDSMKGLKSSLFSGFNTTGFSLVGAGSRSADGKFEKLHETAYWFYPSEYILDINIYASSGQTSALINDLPGDSGSTKKRGFPVRCVMVE